VLLFSHFKQLWLPFRIIEIYLIEQPKMIVLATFAKKNWRRRKENFKSINQQSTSQKEIIFISINCFRRLFKKVTTTDNLSHVKHYPFPTDSHVGTANLVTFDKFLDYCLVNDFLVGISCFLCYEKVGKLRGRVCRPCAKGQLTVNKSDNEKSNYLFHISTSYLTASSSKAIMKT
jgi:hypothetical protein